MTLQWVLGWWNLIFVVPFGIALVYLAVSVTTGIDFGEADAVHDFDVDHDIDADADADVDHEIDADGDVGHDGDADQSSHSWLSLFGIGRVPLSLLILIALFVWGISGFAITQVVHQSIDDGARVAMFAAPIAAGVTIVLTSLIASFFARVVPKDGTPAICRRDLVGRQGVSIFEIGESFGLARVSPADGSASVQVPCRVADGQLAIAANEAVVVLRFDRREQLFYVSTPDRIARARAAAETTSPTLTPAPTPR